MNRPSFAVTVAALRTTDPRFPWVKPSPEEDDVAAVLQHIEEAHQGADEVDDDGCHWGTCGSCGTPWPCEKWVWAEHLAVLWLGRAADRVWAHAKQVMDGLAERERERNRRPA